MFSNINLYADNEVTPRDRALDYLIPEFSADGGTWQRGQLVNVFQRGWREGLMQENFIARFTTDLAGAKFVRLRARALGGGHDGNAQIDAVVASSVGRPVS